MHKYQPGVKPYGELVRRICAVVDPIARVVDNLSYLRLDRVTLNAKIAFGSPKCPSPPPYLIEHPAVEATQERFVQDVPPTAKGPLIGFENILLFKFVVFTAQRDMRRNEPMALVRCKRCCVVVSPEKAGHFSSHRRAGRCMSCSIKRLRCS